MNNITIQTRARIHIALLNESGYLGRIDGSIGFAIDSPGWKVCVYRELLENSLDNLEPEMSCALESLYFQMKKAFDLPDFFYSISGRIENHIGLGSKTSLLMGFGSAVNQLFGLNLSSWEVAQLSGRGSTSGVGYWASQKGGFLWDAGRKYPEQKASFAPSSSSNAVPPDLVLTIDLPRFYVCHFRFEEKGIYGSEEISLFNKYCPTSHDDTKKLLAVVSGLLVPSLISSDEDGVQVALRSIQSLGLKAIEWDHQGAKTLHFKKFWDSRQLATALCLSSMGSTMFCLTQNPDLVMKIIGEYSFEPMHCRVSKILGDIK